MKKIIYVLDKPNLYGSELHLFKLSNLLEKDYSINVCAFSNGPLLDKFKSRFNIKIFNIKWFPTVSILSFALYIIKNKIDIIHAHQPKAIFWSSIIGRIIGVKTIVTIHSLPENNKDTHPSPIKGNIVFLWHCFVKFCAEFFSNKIVFLSKYTYDRCFFKKKAIVIPNWIDVTIKPYKKTLSFPLKFISIGSVTFNKGFDRLIDSLFFIKNKEWFLDVYGDYTDEYIKILKNKILKNGLEDKINFKGYVEDVSNLLDNYDMFILFSRSETFGMVFIEAMARGLPLIVWDIPITKEIIPSENLVISNMEDIKKIYDTDFIKEYNLISSKNLCFVKKNFSTEIVKEKYKQLYD
jgi:wfdN